MPKGATVAKKLFLTAKHFHRCTDVKALDFVHVWVAMKNALVELLRELLEIEEAAHRCARGLNFTRHAGQRTIGRRIRKVTTGV